LAVNALGLGEITVKSQLNEPLNAEIRLLKVGDLSKEEVLVFLASREDFSRAGVDRIFFLNDLQFDVFLGNPAYPFVRIISEKPVTEPFLNFLVDVQWPTGRLVREYTVLLDLPTFTEQAPETVNAPARATPSAPQSSSTVTTAPRSERSTAAPAVDRSIPSDSYRVERGDTLFEIAARSRPSGAVSINQTMLAIQRANPDAFISDNINLLQSGRVLRIPTESEINRINDNIANEEVKTQNRVWSGAANAQGQAALTSSSNTNTTSGQASEPSGRLTLGSADSGSNAAQGSGNSASGSALQNELAIAQEELDRSSRENSELQSRITELEEQISTMEQLISVSNDQLRALELSVQQNDVVPSTDETSVLDNVSDELTTAANDAQATIDEALTNAPVIDEPVVEEPVVDVAPVEIEEPVVIEEPPVIDEPVVEVPAVQTPGLMDFIKEKWQVIAGVVGGLLLLIFLALKMRNSRKADEDDDAFDFDEDNDFIEDDIHAGDDFVNTDDVDGLDDELDIEDDIEAETEDVIAEADIYISLGQEDKAIELLQKEIQQNPGNADARLGLLGIFAGQQDVESFDNQYAQLLPLGDNYATDQAKELRNQMANATPFDEDSYSFDEGGSGIDDLGELDLGEDSFDELTEDNNKDSVDELDLDLGVDLDLDEGSSISSELSDADDITELDGLDLDIEDEDFLGASVTEEFEISTDLDELESDSLEQGLDLTPDSNTDELLDEIAEAADVDDEGLGSELDDGIDDLDDLDLDLDLDFDELDDDVDDNIVEFDLDEDDAGEVEGLDMSLDEDISEGLDELADNLDLEPMAQSIEESMDVENLLDAEDNDLDELSLDISDDLEGLTDEVSEEISIDNDMLNVLDSSESLEADALISQEDTLPTDMDFEANVAEEILDDIDDENKLSFDEPMDLDIDDLDQEIDAMTADLDDTDLELNASEEPDSDDVEQETETQEDTSEIVLSEDDDLSFLDETDEVATKLDLAKAYLDMGDHEGAQDILNEVVAEGNEKQIDEAKALMKDI